MEKQGALEANLVTPRSWLLLAALLMANVALALGPWFVRLADSGPVAAGFCRLFLALPFFALLTHKTGPKLRGLPRKPLFRSQEHRSALQSLATHSYAVSSLHLTCTSNETLN